jgi:hypothetical protein
MLKLWETIALCTRGGNKPVALLVDLNSRTGSLQSSSLGAEWVERWKRVSSDPDEKINTRGRAVIQECDLYDLCILDGTSLETSSPGRFTSWQTTGQSVIDYAIVSESLLPLVQRFHVEVRMRMMTGLIIWISALPSTRRHSKTHLLFHATG